MRRPSLRHLIGAAACLAVASAADAQQADSLVKFITYATPTAPALALIGGSADKIARPTTAKDIATTFANAVNESGKVVQGLAVEFGSGLFTRKMDRETYRSAGGYLRSNLAFSIGTTKAAGDSAATNVGFGVRATLLNRGDAFHMRAPGANIITGLQKCLLLYDPNDTTKIGKQKPVVQCRNRVEAEDSTEQANWVAEHWNAWSVGVAAAYATQLEGSEFGNASRFGWSASAVVAAPFCFDERSRGGLCPHGQWLFQVAHDSRDSLSAAEPEMNRTTMGARLNLGSDKLGFFGEVLAASYGATPSRGSRTASEWSAGLEWRATDDIWVSTGLGNRYNAAVGKEKAVVLAGLHFNTYSKRKFAVTK